MSNPPRIPKHLILFGATALAAWLLASPAAARKVHRHDPHAGNRPAHARVMHHEHGHYRVESHVRGHRHVRLDRRVHVHRGGRYVLVVPRRIRSFGYAHYRPYYRGVSWFRPHGHYHSVYLFPVRTEAGLIYRPHYYCRGTLFGSGARLAYHGRHVGFSVGF
jgi:hypothetical protein